MTVNTKLISTGTNQEMLKKSSALMGKTKEKWELVNYQQNCINFSRIFVSSQTLANILTHKQHLYWIYSFLVAIFSTFIYQKSSVNIWFPKLDVELLCLHSLGMHLFVFPLCPLKLTEMCGDKEKWADFGDLDPSVE